MEGTKKGGLFINKKEKLKNEPDSNKI